MKPKKFLRNLGVSIGITSVIFFSSAITASAMTPLKCEPTWNGGMKVHYAPIQVR
ncbi:hypothetical protein GCM10026983_30330 [Gracilibacillus alcaliphilus]